VLTTLGALRLEVADRIGIERTGYAPLWITEFPFFEWNEETEQWDAMHHPFTSPLDECIAYLDSDPDKVYAKAYDLVLNGWELASWYPQGALSQLADVLYRLYGLFGGLPVIGLLSNLGVYVNLAMILMLHTLRGRRWIAWLPLVLSVCVVFLAPVCSTRYALPIFYGIPVLLGFTVAAEREKQE